MSGTNTIFLINDDNAMVLSSDRSKWTELPLKLPYKTIGSGVTFLDEEIYLIGDWKHLKKLYKLDKNLKWIRLANMNIGRKSIENSCLAWNGCIWVMGGDNEAGKPIKHVERYDPKENTWTFMPDMQYIRRAGAAVVWDDKIVISGGFAFHTGSTNTVECFNPKNGSWTVHPELSIPDATCGHSFVYYKKKFITIGGYRNGEHRASNAVWEIDPYESNATWRPLEPMKNRSTDFAGIVLDNEIYAIGGWQARPFDYQKRVEIFDGENWREGPSLPDGMHGMSATIIPQSLAERLRAYEPE